MSTDGPIYFTAEVKVDDTDMPIHALDDLVEMLNGYGSATEDREEGDRIVKFQFSTADVPLDKEIGDHWAAIPSTHLAQTHHVVDEQAVIRTVSIYATLTSHWKSIATEVEQLGFTITKPTALPF